MFRMAVAHTDDIDPDDVVRSLVEQCRESLGDHQPKAGFLFSTFPEEPEALVAGIGEAYPGIELVGSSVAGEMSSVLGFQEDSVALALFASDSVDITAGLGANVSSDPRAAARQAVEEARGKTDKEPRLCITIPSAGGYDLPVLIEELRSQLGDDVAVLGGGSAPRSAGDALITAYQFYRDRVEQDSVPILLFSDPLVYSFGVDTGWRPVGRKGSVTRAGEGTIHEIDGKPAVAFWERYLGRGATPTSANPLAVFESDSDDFYLRVAVFVDPTTGAIRVPGSIPAGSMVQLTVAVTDEIFEGSKSAVTKAIKGYPEGSSPDGALIFSCAIRKLVLGTRTGRELEITHGELGATVPIFGAYCFGEIAPIESGAPRLHNETMLAVLLGAP